MQALAQAIDSIEARMRTEVAKEFTKLAYASLSPANSQPWNRDGFYTARSAGELAEHGFMLPLLEREFAVPPDCPFWSAPFAESGRVYRGFLRHAWMPLPEGEPSGVLALAVRGVYTMIQRPMGILASVGNEVLEPLSQSSLDHDTSLLLWRAGGADPKGVLHLHCSAPVVQSSRLGRVSVVVSKPFWSR